MGPAVPSKGQLMCRSSHPGGCGPSSSMGASSLASATLMLAISGTGSSRQGILFPMAFGFICTSCCKSDRKGSIYEKTPLSSLSLEKVTPVVSGTSNDMAVLLICYTAKLRALSHEHFCICTAISCKQSHWLKREHLAQVQ